MRKTVLLSDEMLNAFVDDELEGTERERVILLEAHHQDVANAINETRQLKFLVKAAREPEPEKTSTRLIPHYPSYKIWAIAASIMITVATLSILSIVLLPEQDTSGHAEINYSSKSSFPNSSRLLAAARQQTNLKLVFHLNSLNDIAATQLLAEINRLLINGRQYQQMPQIEVIATGTGIQLLTSTAKVNLNKKIQQIQEHSPNVTFLVCGTSLKKIQKTNSVELTLIQKTMLVASGKDWISKRKHQGWSYIGI